MTLEIIFRVFLLGIALSMDAFAISVVDGLTYTDINNKKSFFIAGVFGFMQGLMPLIGYWVVELVEVIVGETAGANAGLVMADVVTYIAFGLLIILGGKMVLDGLKDMKKPPEEKKGKKFSYKEVLYFGVATSIDALGTGVALHSGLSNNSTIFLHVNLIMYCTFAISLIGLFSGNKIEKLLKGKFEITNIIGGVILLLLGVWILIEHFL